MERWKRGGYLVILDFVLINLASLGALFLRFEAIPAQQWQAFLQIFLPASIVRVLCHYFFGLYRRAWRYASVQEVLAIVGAVTAGSFFNLMLRLFWFGSLPPRSVVVLDWFLCTGLVGGIRFLGRLLAKGQAVPQTARQGEAEKTVLIVGAGDGGVLVARELRNHYGGSVKIAGFIDDDPLKQNQKILGIPVLGTKEQIPQVASTHEVDEIIISMPSVPRKVIRELVTIAQQTGRTVKILPGVFDLLEGNVTVSKIREVQIEDLLGREPVRVDVAGMSAYLQNRTVLVTGAGGSIGSELCRQIALLKPKRLLLLDICENNVYEIELELKATSTVQLVPLVKDIRDRAAVDAVFARYKPEVVFHAAAHKHVPLMECNPEEAVKNNVYGTYLVAQAARRYGAEKFVLVSTDKAVNPTSIMGASKRIAEMIIQHLDEHSTTNFVAVRFGNVLGSRGSVIPLFRRQIMAGGPVTVTHREMIRYFMTIPEAVQLILQAGALGHNGEIFVLDMGEPVKILDLAETLIRLSGLQPYVDIDIKITGMRPGEKLYEELLTAEEGVNATTHQRIFVAKPACLDRDLLAATVAAFDGEPSRVLPADQASTVAFIQRFLPDFEVVTNAQPALAEAAATGTED